MVGTPSYYPGADGVAGTADDCDTPDIVLDNGQRWAACNVGATTAYVGGAGQPYPSATATRTAAQKAYMGAIFQWGRNDDVTAGPSNFVTKAPAGTSASGVGHSNFIRSSSSPYDWIATQNGNLWGGGSTSLGSGNYAGQTAGNQALMQGPCAAGYHVPTQAEWGTAIAAVPAPKFVTALRLPLSGYRYFSSANYAAQGTHGYYWTSSPTGTKGYAVVFTPTSVSSAITENRALGSSVRCVAD